MVDPVSLTLGAAAATFLVKVIDKAGEGIGEAIPPTVAKVVAWIRKRFAGRHELAMLEQVPDSPGLQKQLADVIDAELVTDEQARADLQALVSAAQAARPGGVFHVDSISATNGGIAAAQINGTVTNTWAGGAPDPREGSGTH